MTLSETLADLYRRLNYASSPATAVTTRLTSFINLTHRELLGLPGMTGLRNATGITFASVADQSRYGLPPAIERIHQIHERTTPAVLQQIPHDEIAYVDTQLASSGSSEYYALIGYLPVALQPAAATGIWAVSSSASDTTPTVTIEALRTGGYYNEPSAVTLTGTTRVAIGTLTDYIEVTKFWLSAACVGSVSLYTASSGGTELARIPIGSTSAQYVGIQLWPPPASAITYYVDALLRIEDLVASNEVSKLPRDFHYLLVEGALRLEYEHLDDSRYVVAVQRFTKGVSSLKHFIWNPPDFRPQVGGTAPRLSRLGGWFPAGS